MNVILLNVIQSSHYKINQIVNKFLLAGDKTAKIKKKAGDSRYIYRNKLDKPCCQRDMANGYFKGLAKRTASDKFLRDKTFNIAKTPTYDGYQRDLASMVYKFFDKKLLQIVALNKINNLLKNYTNQLLKI